MKRNKNIATATLIMGLLCWSVLTALAVGAQDTTPQFWLSSEIAEAAEGQEFTVTVNVAGASAVYGGSFQLLYDPLVFEVVLIEEKAVMPGAFFGEEPSFALKNTADAANGIVDYALTLTQPAQPVTGDGVLGTVTFRALQNAPVTITTSSAELVSPEFTEVDGRMIAQKINQVEAQVTDMVVAGVPVAPVENLNLVPESASDSVSASVPVIDAGVSSASLSSAPAPVLVEERRGGSNNKMLVVAGLFFVGGLLLLTVSVGMYSKMRVGFTLAGDYPPERPL
jgi:hypothetical protein